jgi:hypothetical protein
MERRTHMKTTRPTLVSSLCFLLGFFLVMGGVAYGQQALDVRLMDTSAGRRVLLLDPGVAGGQVTLLFPSYIKITAVSRLQPLPFIGNDLGFYTPAGPSVFRQPMDPIAPLRLQWESGRKMYPITVVLGAAVTGAACYMAYEHVRKYGFLN